jgi:hypothetical protein
MAEPKDQEITAALGRLAAQDAKAADDAGAALDWIAGGQGLGLVTQERIQTFCWYELPVKWLTSLDDKVRVADALAQALDLLGLPRYAMICPSGTTHEILNAYETSIEKGKAAFRHAAAASGIQPPDLPGFEWGATMGLQEGSAWSFIAGILELAVVGGDLVPGASGWKTRQRELVQEQLSVRRADLMGQTLGQLILTERAETWVNVRRSATRRQILAAIVNRLLYPAQLPAEATDDPLPRLNWLLLQLDGGIALTQADNLSQKFVQRSAVRFGWDVARPPRTEDDVYELHDLRRLAQRLRLARRAGRTLTLTVAGRRLAADPERLWRATAAGLLDGDDFSVFVGELCLAMLLDTGPVLDEKIKATVGRAVAEEGFLERRSGQPPGEQDISRAIHDTIYLWRSLGLLTPGGDWTDRSYELTAVGQATALEALRARATGPRTIPWF